MKPLFRIIRLLEPAQQQEALFLTVGIAVMAVLEVVGIGAVGPFVSLALSPDGVAGSPVATVLARYGIHTGAGVVTIAGLGVIALIVVGNSFTTYIMYRVYRWSNFHTFTFGRRLLTGYLGRPYTAFLTTNTSELSKNVLTEVSQAIHSGIRPFAELIARGTVAVAIFVLLFLQNATVAAAAFFVIGGAYASVYGLLKSRLLQIGRRLRHHNHHRFKTTQEAFGSIKLIKVMNLESSVDADFSRHTRNYAVDETRKQVLSNLPRYFLETVVISLMVATIVIATRAGNGLTTHLSTASVFAFAALRLMPAMQVVLRSLSQIRAATAVIENLISDLSDGTTGVDTGVSAATAPEIEFRSEIVIEHFSYYYPGTDRPALDRIDLRIPHHAMVGLVGPTGCGKTTLVDALMGLLPADRHISVDGSPLLPTTVPAWQRRIGYVPQDIYLVDDTVARNIAFGVSPDDIDMEQVARVGRVARINDFVVQQLPAGYDTPVGERGVRLSGGQIQRIGIARALYRDPDILVFDEATSALDSDTERAVMASLEELMGKKTIVVIAHRLNTIAAADQIVVLNDGAIVDRGTYHELMERSEVFRRLAYNS